MERFEAHLEERVRSSWGTSHVVEMLEYHFGYGQFGPARKGKRLRPNLVIRMAQATAHQARKPFALYGTFDAAAAVEMLHNYSLVHDDIEDRDELRHGKQTLWKKYGIAQAINAGDALCALSTLTLFHACKHHPQYRVLSMIKALHGAHRIMCDGQSLDLQFEAAGNVTLEEYERMIACKTAALFSAACELGALCGAAEKAPVEKARDLGLLYGRAFQIRDDILGIWADSDATGKMSGVDIARRKWTFPIVWALEQPASPHRTIIAQAYAAREPIAAADVARIIDALDRLGARQAAEEEIDASMRALENFSYDEVTAFLRDSLRPMEGVPVA